MPLPPIVHRTVLTIPAEHAFRLFTERLAEWWPLAYTFSGAELEHATIEPHVEGRWLERDRHGNEIPWGEVRAYEPHRRVVLTFAISADRKPIPFDHASEVEVRFFDAGERRTSVELEHRDFERHGKDAEALRRGMDSPHGWPLILAELRRAARRGGDASGD